VGADEVEPNLAQKGEAKNPVPAQIPNIGKHQLISKNAFFQANACERLLRKLGETVNLMLSAFQPFLRTELSMGPMVTHPILDPAQCCLTLANMANIY
jgi:hypothetical protein